MLIKIFTKSAIEPGGSRYSRSKSRSFDQVNSHISKIFGTWVNKSAFFNVTFYAEFDGLKVLYLEFVLDDGTPCQGLFENAKTVKKKSRPYIHHNFEKGAVDKIDNEHS